MKVLMLMLMFSASYSPSNIFNIYFLSLFQSRYISFICFFYFYCCTESGGYLNYKWQIIKWKPNFDDTINFIDGIFTIVLIENINSRLLIKSVSHIFSDSAGNETLSGTCKSLTCMDGFCSFLDRIKITG